MKLTFKWLLWFVLVAVYAAILGGLFYYNLFKFTFDTKLQREMIAAVNYRAPQLIQGLAARPKQVSFNEANQMKDLVQNDTRIKSVIYLNYDGSIRWHENTKFMGMAYTDYNNSVGFDTNAAVQAIRSKTPRAILTAGGEDYDMAIPIMARGDTVAGVVNLIVSRQAARELISQAMVKYTVGAIIILVLIGGVLYLFLLLKVLRPLVALKDALEAVSLNNLNLSVPVTKDEIGDVAKAAQGMLDKIKEDMKGLENTEIMSLEKEKTWWKAVFAVAVPKGTKALVVDENNNVLYSNFELKIGKGQKVHLLDIFDGRQQEIIQVVGEALEKPTKVLRSSVVNKNVKCKVKAVQLPDDAGKNRIVVVLEPEE